MPARRETEYGTALREARERFDEACRVHGPALDAAQQKAIFTHPTDRALMASSLCTFKAATGPALEEWERLIRAGYEEARKMTNE